MTDPTIEEFRYAARALREKGFENAARACDATAQRMERDADEKDVSELIDAFREAYQSHPIGTPLDTAWKSGLLAVLKQLRAQERLLGRAKATPPDGTRERPWPTWAGVPEHTIYAGINDEFGVRFVNTCGVRLVYGDRSLSSTPDELMDAIGPFVWVGEAPGIKPHSSDLRGRK